MEEGIGSAGLSISCIHLIFIIVLFLQCRAFPLFAGLKGATAFKTRTKVEPYSIPKPVRHLLSCTSVLGHPIPSPMTRKTKIPIS